MRLKLHYLLGLRTATGCSLLVAFGACSGSDPVPNSTPTGGNATAGASHTGGNSSSGGVGNAGGNGPTGGTVSTGGTAPVAGGTSTGGTPSTGGSQGLSGSGTTGGTGGGTSTGGGATAGGSAGSPTNSGGSPSTGGAKATGGGSSTGGTSSTGGSKATGGTAATGGSKATGGTSSTGGTGGTNASCPNADPTELALVSAWLNNTTATGALPNYAYSNIKANFPAGAAFDKLACSIAMSCKEFAPMETNWLRKCEAVVTSAIVAESSYNPSSVVVDAYATRTVSNVTANDPTVGLLQIRFSSTVHDYNFYGPLAKMTSIGCTWPTALSSQADTATWWATNGGTSYLSFMQDPACNIGLATWYYFYNATGNGGSSAVWISDYCAGRGAAGNMVVGLLSHLMGGNYSRPLDTGNAYPWGIECCSGGNPSVTTCTGCTGRFAAFMGIGTSSARPSPDPFLEQLAPQPTKYCK